jgi:hypothetical protein
LIGKTNKQNLPGGKNPGNFCRVAGRMFDDGCSNRLLTIFDLPGCSWQAGGTQFIRYFVAGRLFFCVADFLKKEEGRMENEETDGSGMRRLLRFFAAAKTVKPL